MHQETLYKTEMLELYISEHYVIAVLDRPGNRTLPRN
jgi:hypothetical protein